MFSGNYNKAMRACKAAEDESEIDTAAGESDRGKCGRGQRVKRPKQFDDDEDDDRQGPKPVNRRKRVRVISDSEESMEDGEDDIRKAVQSALMAPKQKGKTVKGVGSKRMKSRLPSHRLPTPPPSPIDFEIQSEQLETMECGTSAPVLLRGKQLFH